MKLGSPAAMSKEPPNAPADAPGHAGMSVEEIEGVLEEALKDNETVRAGYALLMQHATTVIESLDFLDDGKSPNTMVALAKKVRPTIDQLRAQLTEAQKQIERMFAALYRCKRCKGSGRNNVDGECMACDGTGFKSRTLSK